MERKSTTQMAFRQRRRRIESLSTPIQKCTPISRNPFLPVVTWSIRRAGRQVISTKTRRGSPNCACKSASRLLQEHNRAADAPDYTESIMDRRTFLQVASLVPAGALEAMAQQYEGQPAGHLVDGPPRNPRPNVIWILGDQFRAQALASNGDPNARTPNLDRAATNGVTFTNNLSGFPLCCPFRGSMLTSRYPHHCVPGHEYPLPAGQQTIADRKSVVSVTGVQTCALPISSPGFRSAARSADPCSPVAIRTTASPDMSIRCQQGNRPSPMRSTRADIAPRTSASGTWEAFTNVEIGRASCRERV